ncbi:zinc ribbon domain-containing protein [Streptomyces sp. cg36]|uniref:NADase-type glycan-binding domain-containing protein n=1 Tax=Streptomyces sp. cg36 TaxID=3238798 RepID=UPI0034E301B4
MTTPHCAECGTRAEPGQSFCDSCGAVLGWDRAAAHTARPAADSATARDTLERPGPAAPAPRPADATGAPERDPAPGTGRPPAVPDPPRRPAEAPPAVPAPRAADDTAPTVPVEPVPSRDGAGAPPESDSDRARQLLVPVADPEPPAATPPPAVAPVLPGRPDAERPQVRGPGPYTEAVTGPPCRWCATPNRPDRHFCGRCAMPLADEAAPLPPGRLPWWRRLFRRDREVPWAGERPPLRRVFDRIGTWVGAVVAVTLIVLGILYIPDAVNAGRDHFAKRAPVAPDSMRASRSFPDHPPQLAFDKKSNTWWGPGVAGPGQGQWIEASFDEPTRLLDVILTPGVSARPERAGESALPHRLLATITKKDGKTSTREITLDQGSGGQRRSFRVGEVVKVRFTVESSYGASDKKQVSIAEIEFFGRSNSNHL